ncbi:MAG: 4Fe-4S binding protein [Methanomassiliicoccales archaeon]|nr:MAG: 4Fe-4S binding protein [Methanomassiliicoccales archaeon]
MKLWRKPLDADDWEPPKGKIYIIEERCKGCGFCEEFCPRKVLEESDKYNSRGYHPPEVVNPDDCVHCELCELICPEFAIFVLDAKEMESKKPKKKRGKGGGSKKTSQKKKSSKKQTSKKTKKGGRK